MKKQLLLSIFMLSVCVFSIPLTQGTQKKNGTATIKPKTTTYVGDSQTASHLGRFYAVYTDGGTSIIQVVDYATLITYTATGTFTPGSPGHLPTGSFTVVDNGINIDTYSGSILF